MNITIVEAVQHALDLALAKDKTVMLMGEDIGINGGVFRATDGLQKKYGKQRVVDTPLAEEGFVGTGVGLAIAGMKPVVEIQFMGFLSPACEQIVSHASRVRCRSRGNFSCPMVIRAPFSGGIHAPEHHSESTEALYMHTPGLKVVIPSSPYDTKGLLLSAIKDPDPVLFLEPKRVYRAIREEVPKKYYEVPIGKANVLQEGTDCTVISWGSMVRDCKAALENVQHSVELIDLRTIYPIDYETILKSVEKTGKVVIVQEAPRTCSVASELGATITEKAFYSLEKPIIRVTGWDTVMPLALREQAYLPSRQKIAYEINKVCG